MRYNISWVLKPILIFIIKCANFVSVYVVILSCHLFLFHLNLIQSLIFSDINYIIFTFRFDHLEHYTFLRDKVSAALRNFKNILLFWKILLFQNSKRYKELAAFDEYNLYMTYVFEVEIYFWPVPPLVTVCHFQTKETLRSRLTFLLLLPLTFFCRSPFFSFLLFQALNLFLWYRNTDQVTLWKRSRVVCRLLQKCLPNFFIAAGFGSDAYRYIIIFL